MTNFEPWNKYDGPIVDFIPNDDKFLFLSYNRQPRVHRARFIIELLRKNLLNRGKVSFNRVDSHTVIPMNENEKKFLLENTPITINSNVDLYYNYAVNITREDYVQTFMSVVTETLADSGTLFLSEKIWKPILVGHPFMVFGNKGTLSYLKSMGYKTFDKWIDESYDDIEDRDYRCIKIVSEISKFASKSVHELSEIRNEMKEICQHNQNVFKKKYLENYNEHDYSRKLENALKEIWEEIKNN